MWLKINTFQNHLQALLLHLLLLQWVSFITVLQLICQRGRQGDLLWLLLQCLLCWGWGRCWLIPVCHCTMCSDNAHCM
jgi:hypothetical protein